MRFDATHHRHVPKDPAENLAFRLDLLEQCDASPGLRADVLRACGEDVLFWINAFAWQYNPRHIGGEVGPFVTYPYQDEAFLVTADRLFVKQKDAYWPKSREMGATWMALLLYDWMALLHRHKKLLAFSHMLDAVDRADDPDSLFWKVKFINEHLPDWMSRGARKRKLGFKYPATQSAFNGTAPTKRTGVGGRATAVFSDETAKQDLAFDIIGQTRDTGPRLFVSTFYGVGSAFYVRCQQSDTFKVTMHWSQHPAKNRGLYRSLGNDKYEVIDAAYPFPAGYRFVADGSPFGGPCPGLRSPWYDTECVERASARDIRLNLDIDPAGSDEQFFDQAVIRGLIRDYAWPPAWEGDLFVDYATAQPLMLSERRGGPLRLWVRPKLVGQVRPEAVTSVFAEGWYGVGADVSAGTGATPSCLSVVNAATREKVAEYTDSHAYPDKFAAVAVALCRALHGAKIVWEEQGPGATFGKELLKSFGYRNVYYRRTEQPERMTVEVSDSPGFHTSSKSKLSLFSEYRAALQGRVFVNRSEPALEECLSIRYDAGGYVEHSNERTPEFKSGARVSHADLVVADALAWKMAAESGVRAAREERAARPPEHSLAGRRAARERYERQREWA